MLERIKAYIDGGQAVQSKSRKRYDIIVSKIAALMQKATESPYDAVVLAFKYGLEKGYRMAKAEK